MSLPALYGSGRLALSRQEEKALVRQAGATAVELLAVDQVELVERAKVRVVGAVTREAIHEVQEIANDVMACQQENPFGAHLAADLAIEGKRQLKERIEHTSRRLG